MKNDKDNIIKYNREIVSDIFRRKKEFHRRQARLPVEEKIKILIELQKIALTIRPRKGVEDRRAVWKLT